MSARVTTLILGGGRGTRLSPLTDYRSKPAVPIGGKYRLVDIPVSNCLNSGLKKIFILTQFNSRSLHRHIHRAYPYEPFHQTSVELLAAEQTLSSVDWFQGTADAVRKHFHHYQAGESDTVLILSGDHLYRMDYREILDYHDKSGADVTVASIPVPRKEISGFGIMDIEKDGTIKAFIEKPQPTDNVDHLIMPKNICEEFKVTQTEPMFMASMGIYVFKNDVLRSVLSGSEKDFGKEIIPRAIKNFKVHGYVFNGYWRDIGTIQSFFDANLDLAKSNPPFHFISPEGTTFTRSRFLPPAYLDGAKLKSVLLGDGCVLNDVELEEVVIGLRAVVGEGTVIRRSILMGNDYYNGIGEGAYHNVGIGKNCRIENCIIDKNVLIDDNVTITNPTKIQNADAPNYVIREGIVIIPKGAHILSGTQI